MPADPPPLTEPSPVPTLLVTGWAVGRVNSLVHMLGWATMRIAGQPEEHHVQVRVATPVDSVRALSAQLQREISTGGAEG